MHEQTPDPDGEQKAHNPGAPPQVSQRYIGPPLPEDDGSTVFPRDHRSSTILTLGILSVFCFPIGIAAWVMANKDLAMMRAGEMDHSGERLTNTGRIIAMASLFLNALMIVGKLVN